MPDSRPSKLARFQPPTRQSGHIDRPRLVRAIETHLDSEPVLLVVAPSGYGKTSAVSEWAATHPGRVAWVTLEPFGTDPVRLGLTVLRALQEVARSESGADLADLASVNIADLDPATAFELISETLSEAAAPVYLVVDDAHRARDHLMDGLLGALIEIGCDPLKAIIVGSTYTEIAMSRFALTHPHAAIRSHELAFERDEIARMPGGSEVDPETVLGETRGWPIAIRFMQLTGIRPRREDEPDESLILDYVRNHLLAAVPIEIKEFALVTSVCDDMTVGLAAAVSGREDSADFLERCVRMGLFIDRYDTPRGRVYRWHGVFAQHCRDILDLEHPGELKRAYARVAGYLESRDALLAATSWLKAGDPEAAVEAVLSRWVALVVVHDATAFDQWCASLPHPYADDPRILLVRACAQDVAGARGVGQMLAARARARAELLPETPGFQEIYDQAMLLLIDDRAELSAAAERLRRQFESASSSSSSPQDRAATLYLLGFAELRHRGSLTLAAQLLSSAAVEAEAIGDSGLAGRAFSNLAFVLAWSGQFRRAQEVLARRGEFADNETWIAYAGGGAPSADGLIAYWQDDLDRATVELTRAVHSGSSALAFAGVSRMMLAFTAAASRDPETCHRAARELQAIPSEETRGVSWPEFRQASLACLHEAAGHRDRAMKIVERYQDRDDLPLVTVVLSGIATRSGQVPLALRMLKRLTRYMEASYIRVTTLATESLLSWQQGHQHHAHELLEEALAAASEEDVRRPFSGSGLEMRKLLAEHLAWGTQHEEFITRCLAPRQSPGLLGTLSERERAVFAQLRTTKTMQEIADTLGVSVNTVKTHQRSIYRKLGVTTRREAVRLFA